MTAETLTASVPPTEAEIRQAIQWAVFESEERAHVDDLASIVDNLDSLARQAAAPIVCVALETLSGLAPEGWEPVRAESAGFWRDLRPSEALELRELVDFAIGGAVADCRQAIADRLTAAALAFASAHPDVPRGTWAPLPDPAS